MTGLIIGLNVAAIALSLAAAIAARMRRRALERVISAWEREDSKGGDAA